MYKDNIVPDVCATRVAARARRLPPITQTKQVGKGHDEFKRDVRYLKSGGEWLVLLSAWEGSAWVPESSGSGGRTGCAGAGRARGGVAGGGCRRSVRRAKSI